MRVIVSVEEDKDFNTVVAGLEKAGMRIDQKLHTIGMVTGFSDSLEPLEKVSGVHQIGESTNYQGEEKNQDAEKDENTK